jgi:CMP-N,N'-diacetyllegionaminic acid synthase
MYITAFIPARGGSVSMPDKNLAEINAMPLTCWAMNSACRNHLISKIVVSSDSEEILDLAENWKALSSDKRIVVSKRPKELSDGITYNIAEIATKELDRLDIDTFDKGAVLLLQPTSPFVKQSQIDKAIYSFSNPKIRSTQTITPVLHNDHWINQRRWVNINGVDKYCLFTFWEDRLKSWNKQKKPPAYKFGNLVITRRGDLRNKTFFAYPSAGILIDRWSSLDIDTEDDVTLGRMYHKEGLVA